jgi:hypothetical protein
LATVGAMLGVHFPSFYLAAISLAFSNSKISKMSKDMKGLLSVQRETGYTHTSQVPQVHPEREIVSPLLLQIRIPLI